MATHNITIDEEGTPTPKDMGRIEREDIVCFFVGSEPMILCLPVKVFGVERMHIPTGDSAAVRVKPDAHVDRFKYFACALTAETVNSTCEILEDEVNNPTPNSPYKGDSGDGSVGM